jgi:hypothetical protein
VVYPKHRLRIFQVEILMPDRREKNFFCKRRVKTTTSDKIKSYGMPFEMYKVKIKAAEMKNHFVLTTVLLSSGLFTSNQSTNTKFNLAPAKNSGPVGAVYILIDKSDYELSIYDNQGWYATYPVVFGNNSLSDKKMEGDRNTPEGTFKITSKRVHDKWYRFMSIDYPNKESWEKFNRRKQKGEIPASAKIGGRLVAFL